ncbi:MAG: hypothetical protein QOH06_359 [Acidobacteriota bacterium]|jgi:hypothetical protein|nr:hypothetical protein [Acidobacteriota bacterium]
MNRKAWTTTPLLAGLFLLVVGVPGAVADETTAPEMSSETKLLGNLEDLEKPAEGWFKADPDYTDEKYDAEAQLYIYAPQPEPGKPGKHMNKTANPPVELGRRLYDRGAYEPRPTWLGAKNPINFHLMAYGDLRVGAAYYDNGVVTNGKSEQSVVATRLNLDMDLALTATERIHAFVRPFDRNGSFTRYQISGGVEDEFFDEFDFALDTLFFEGDLGAMTQGWTGKTNSIDLPIALGRVPLFTQNGIWLDDAFNGLAMGITAKSSPSLDISNMDFTFFAGFEQVTTAAVPGSNGSAKVFGLAGFADGWKGYAEYGYGYIDSDVSDLSYHNVTAAFTKRYGGRVNNSVRLIGNFGQSATTKTADGVLVLVENSLVPRRPVNAIPSPVNLVPYFNLFAGFDTPQPLARAADSGGVLKNTGINFESDGLTGYPTLDTSGHESYGGALGVEYLFSLDRQIVIEASVVERMSDSVLGSQYALGARYQHKISNAWILRLDAMNGWRQGLKDVYGARVEFRRKL